MYFSQLFSSKAYFKVYFEVWKIWLPLFYVNPYYTYNIYILYICIHTYTGTAIDLIHLRIIMEEMTGDEVESSINYKKPGMGSVIHNMNIIL